MPSGAMCAKGWDGEAGQMAAMDAAWRGRRRIAHPARMEQSRPARVRKLQVR